MPQIFVLWKEISDQMGTDKIAGVYSTRQRAESAAKLITNTRTRIEQFDMDKMPLASLSLAGANAAIAAYFNRG